MVLTDENDYTDTDEDDEVVAVKLIQLVDMMDEVNEQYLLHLVLSQQIVADDEVEPEMSPALELELTDL